MEEQRRRASLGHRRIKIQPTEARLLDADTVVLGGGLIEGTWPAAIATDPSSTAHAAQLGLPRRAPHHDDGA